MKYLEELINEASELNERFEESKELLLSIGNASKFETIIYKEIIKKYDVVIISILIQEDFLRGLAECNGEAEVMNYLIGSKN